MEKGEKDHEKLAHDNRPVLIQFYHPETENAKEIQEVYENLAKYTKENKARLSVEAVNMSKTNADFKLTAYPTLRLYTKPGVFEEFKESKLDLLSLKKFLKKNKVNGFFDLEVSKQVNPNLTPEPTPIVTNPIEFPKQIEPKDTSDVQIKK